MVFSHLLWRQRIDIVTLCNFAFVTGMREEEICKLQVDDVDRAARDAANFTCVTPDASSRPLTTSDMILVQSSSGNGT
jgi:hypothetical protein